MTGAFCTQMLRTPGNIVWNYSKVVF